MLNARDCLVGDHKQSLEGEMPTAVLQQVLERWAEELIQLARRSHIPVQTRRPWVIPAPVNKVVSCIFATRSPVSQDRPQRA